MNRTLPDARLRSIDRFGREHVELAPTPTHDWATVQDWDRVEPDCSAQCFFERNPRMCPDPDPNYSYWTWVVRDSSAKAVLLWTNPVFDYTDVSRMEMDRRDGRWTITLRLPSALRFSYRISVWHSDEEPPWRRARGRRNVLLAAAAAGEPDPDCIAIITPRPGEISSVATGPTAPRQVWREPVGEGNVVKLDGDTSVYVPPTESQTPLLVLYDGQNWLSLGLPGILDQLIEVGLMPPVHVLFVDSRNSEHRWENLGVPAGQVDAVIDRWLPAVRQRFAVDPSGERTIVAGQSLGGIAALWTLALSEGDVQHAIAQSPSLWRFDVTDSLLDAPNWTSLHLHAGAYEGDMLLRVRTLKDDLTTDPRLRDRFVVATGFEAGHDWAAWRVNLVNSLRDLLESFEEH